MALVRVYCGLASANPPQQLAVGSSSLSATVIDDSGRLLDICDIGDDPYGYAYLSTLLAERASGPYSVALAADSDQRLVPALLSTAGWAVAFVDTDTTDDFAHRFADELATDGDSAPMQRRALGLARALHAGALSATSMPAPVELAALKPVLAAHGALATGRHAAAVALREVLRELYPAALRAYPDPADPVALAVMEALPEPGALTSTAAGRGRDAAATADAVTSKLAATGLGDPAAVSEAITALRVAIAETSRRSGIGRELPDAVGETVRQTVAAVRACDSASTALVRALAGRIGAMPGTPEPPGAAGSHIAAPPSQPAPTPGSYGHGYLGAGHSEPAPARPTSPVPTPLPPRMVPPVPAAAPLSPPAPAAAPPPPPVQQPPPPPVQQPPPPPVQQPPPPPVQQPPPPPVQQPPPPPVQQPPPPAMRPPGVPARTAWSPGGGYAAPPDGYSPPAVPGGRPVSAPPPPPPGITPIGEPRSPIPGQRPPQEQPDPSPWHDERTPLPTVGSGPPDGGGRPAGRGTQGGPLPSRAAGQGGPERSGGRRRAEDQPQAPSGRPPETTPPWRSEDLVPPEAPSLRLVEPTLPEELREEYGYGGPERSEPPSLHLVEPTSGSNPGSSSGAAGGGGYQGNGYPGNGYAERGFPDSAFPDSAFPDSAFPDSAYSGHGIPRNGVPRSAPPVSADDDDNLLIFAQTRSAWFSGEDDVEWSSRMDAGWRAAEQAASKPAVGDRTGAGLPRRVPHANLVPGSPPPTDRGLRVVRDPSSIAAHTSGYFNGWRRGQEVGGVGGYPLGNRQQSAGAWDFTRDVAQ